MPVSATTLRLLTAAGVTGDALVTIVESIEADHVGSIPRSLGAIRQERYRNKKASLSDVTTPPSPSPRKEKSPTPPKETQPLTPPPESPALPLGDPFDDFWKIYPHKVGKPEAKKAWGKVTQRGSAAAVMAGLGRYISGKPQDRSWLNPATFLNQDRWKDEPAPSNGQTGPPKQRTDAYGFRVE